MCAAGEWPIPGPQHRVVLLVFGLGCVAFVLLAGRLRARPGTQTRVSRLVGGAVLLLCGPFEIEDVVIGVRHPLTGLPLQICDLGWLVAGVALLTGSRRLCSLTYFWGLTLSIQGVLTPDLDHVFPQAQFFGFWVRHIAPVWAAVYLVGCRIGPDWKGFRFSVMITAAWAVVVMGVNASIGSNYGYLNGKPSGASALDLLGPWPWYVVIEIALVVAVWALMTWPWNRAR